MFDAYRITQGPTSTDVTVRVTEQRAPTDQSVQLLKEFEEKARAKLVEQIHLQDNGFNCSILVEEDNLNACRRALVVYTLNGQKHQVMMDIYEGTPGDAIQAVIEKVARSVACNLLEPAFKAMERQQQRLLLRK